MAGSPMSCQRSQRVSSPTHPSPSRPVYFTLGGREGGKRRGREGRREGGREGGRGGGGEGEGGGGRGWQATSSGPRGRTAATHPRRQPRATPVQTSQVCQAWENGLREKREREL